MAAEMWEAFFEFAGSESDKLVTIPTASDENSINSDPEFDILERQFKARGLSDYPYKKDLFFDIYAERWFHFTRDSLGEIIGFDKKTDELIDGKSQRFIEVEE
ncbi:MAG: hypothetical protein ACI84C_001903 [Flavobacteriales bacterium]|jgi:hypothetical protein